MSLQLFSKGWVDTSTFPIITPVFDLMMKSNLMGHFAKKMPLDIIRCFLFNFEPAELILEEYRNRSGSNLALATFYQCAQVVNAINLVNRALKNANGTPRPLLAHLVVVLPLFLVQIPPIIARRFPLDRLPKSNNAPLPFKIAIFIFKTANYAPKICRDHLSKVTQAVMAVAAIVLWKQGEKAYAAGVLASLVYPLALKILAARFEYVSSNLEYTLDFTRSFLVYGATEAADLPMRQAVWSVLKQQLFKTIFSSGLNWLVPQPKVEFPRSFDPKSYWAVGRPPLVASSDLSWPVDRFNEKDRADIQALFGNATDTDKAHIAQMLRSIAKDRDGQICLDAPEKKEETDERPRRIIMQDVMIQEAWSKTIIYSPILIRITRCYLEAGELDRERIVMLYLLKKLGSTIKPPAILATSQDLAEAVEIGYFQIDCDDAVFWLYRQPALMRALFKQAKFRKRIDVTKKLFELGLLVPKSHLSKITRILMQKLL